MVVQNLSCLGIFSAENLNYGCIFDFDSRLRSRKAKKRRERVVHAYVHWEVLPCYFDGGAGCVVNELSSTCRSRFDAACVAS